MKAPPLPIALLSFVQASLGLGVAGVLAYWFSTQGFVAVDDVPVWVLLPVFVCALAWLVSAIQLWRLRWSGPISFLVLWLIPLLASLPFASPTEILRDGAYIEGRISFLLVYAVVVFEFRHQFARGRSANPTAPR